MAAVGVCLLCGCARLDVNGTGLAYYVALDGDDAHSGARGAPFATLERAREAVRTVIRAGVLPPGGLTVCVRSGRYYRSTGFVLSAQDSGVAGRPVVYRAAPGECVRLVGGSALPHAAFARALDGQSRRDPTGAATHVWCADLRALGLASSGALEDCGSSGSDGLDLFFGKQPLRRVRPPPGDPPARGEWRVDPAAGTLCVWPPAKLGTAPLVFATLDDPIVTLEQTAFVTWEGFVLETTRGAAIAVRGGCGNRVVNCTVRNAGPVGIAVSGAGTEFSGCRNEDLDAPSR